jgi:predicted Zn-dependent protease
VRAAFDALADALEACARPGELLAATLESEASDFLRLNGARIRQAGRVERAIARLRLVDGERQAFHALTLPGLDAGPDAILRAVAGSMDGLRASIADSAPDPLLDVNREPVVSDDRGRDAPFDRDAFVDTVAAAAGDADLVGFAAAGPVARGFCTSAGGRQWYQRTSVVFDWSIHLPVDPAAGARKAVKADWSGPRLDAAALAGLAAAIARSRADAAVMARPVRRLDPGEQRVLLAPRAFADLLQMLGWGGFSARAHRSGQSPLARLERGDARFSPLLSMAEDLDAGFAPGFQADGYPRPRRVPLVQAGRFAQWLVSPRTAREYGLPSNAAAAHESPESLRVAPGTLADADALARLGTGLSIANLWYLNFSDRPACRVTGMTRFACLWIEGGEPVAPVEAMRFDDSLYRVLGDTLEALGDAPLSMPATDTYSSRATGGLEAPSALLGSLRFTL